jgi:alkylhydroperoxidase family enzyme
MTCHPFRCGMRRHGTAGDVLSFDDADEFFLEKQGLTDDDIRRMEDDPAQSLLEENEQALLAFVVKAVKAPGSVAADDVARLRQLGWTDRDLVDAMSQGGGMIDHAIMMQAFRMDPDCLLA